MLHLKDLFYLQRNDRQAAIFLLGIFIVCITLVILVGNSSNVSFCNHAKKQAKAQPQKDVSEKKPLFYKVDGVPHELFPFDPNTADSTQLLKLGLQAWQVRSIYKYRAKGGIFRQPSDFARLYGLTKKQYEVLAPYIIIGEDYRPASDYYGKNETSSSAGKVYHRTLNASGYHISDNTTAASKEQKIYSYPQKLRAGEHISANSADTTEWMKIPGIGNYFAKSIIRYRDRLGGFASPTQLLEIEGVPESALAYIHINENEVKKLNINQLSLNQLRQHPYINFYQAKEICEYRRLKGPIHNLQELKLLKNFPPDEIERLKPYISF